MANWYGGIPEPRDKNGDVVPLDTRELVYMGETRRVREIAYNAIAERWAVRLNGPGVARGLSDCTLLDSWEMLEEDAAKTPREYIEGRCVIVERDGRVATMTHDLVRRAKSLAGVSDGE